MTYVSSKQKRLMKDYSGTERIKFQLFHCRYVIFVEMCLKTVALIRRMIRSLLLLLIPPSPLRETISSLFFVQIGVLPSFFPAFPRVLLYPSHFFPFSRVSSIVLQTPSYAFIDKQKSSLPFSSWN